MIVYCSSRLLSVLLLQVLHGSAHAFGPRLEFDLGRDGGAVIRSMVSRSDSHSDDNTHRQKYALHYENRFEEINGEYFQSRLFISEPFLVNPFEFGVVNPFDPVWPAGNTFDNYDEDESLSCGDDCEECSIPDEYKQIDSPIDVMDFLGIRPAKPIQVPNVHIFGDWE